MTGQIRVLCVDDSALMRRLLTDLLSADPDIDVVGTAEDPFDARKKIKQLNPDVLTLDVEMPKMDGISFLRNLMRLHPMPVVMVSTLTDKGSQVTMDALSLGAVDFFAKPRADKMASFEHSAVALIDKVKIAAAVRMEALEDVAETEHNHKKELVGQQSNGTSPVSSAGKHLGQNLVVGIGASTGGVEALRRVLRGIPEDFPPILITQHIPDHFAHSFCERLNTELPLTVCVASDGQRIERGHVYVAANDQHLEIRGRGGDYHCKLIAGDPVNRHRPSVDVLFHSMAKYVGSKGIGVMLTGMGDDGARGMKAFHDTGAPTIVQDEDSSVVWGMPGSVVKLGAADKVCSLSKITPLIIDTLASMRF